MFYIKFFSLFFVFFFISVLLFKISKLDSNKISKRGNSIQQYSIKPYARLQYLITRKVQKNVLKMSDSLRAKKKRDYDYIIDNESMPKKVQRRQREVLRIQTYQPMDTCNLNLDSLPLLFKYFLILFGFTYLYYVYGIILLSTYSMYNFFLITLLYAILHLITSRLVLRHSRFWWWRPWPLVLHRYAKGFRTKNYQKTLYILLLPIPFFFYALAFFLYFARLRYFQSFFYFAYSETLGFIIFSYFVEFSKLVVLRYYVIKKKTIKQLKRLRKPLRTVWRFVRLWRNKPKKKYKKS